MPYTDEEHAALLKAAVDSTREQAREAVKTELSEAHSKIDVLEAEKAAAEQAREEAEKKVADIEAEAERKERVAKRKGQRVKSMKELAGDSLGEEYFTDERQERWANMEDEEFASLLDDFAEAQLQAVGTTKEEAAKLAGLAGDARRKEIASILATHRNTGNDVRRETAAFRGGAPIGDTSSTTTTGDGGSAISQLGKAIRA